MGCFAIPVSAQQPEKPVVEVFTSILLGMTGAPSASDKAALQQIIDRKKTRGPMKSLARAIMHIDGKVPMQDRARLAQFENNPYTPDPIKAVVDAVLKFNNTLSAVDRSRLEQLLNSTPQRL